MELRKESYWEKQTKLLERYGNRSVFLDCRIVTKEKAKQMQEEYFKNFPEALTNKTYKQSLINLNIWKH